MPLFIHHHRSVAKLRALLVALAMVLAAVPAARAHSATPPTPALPVAAADPIEIQVAGAAGVGNGATAVVLQLTVVRPAARGWLTAYPCGESEPTVSNVNFGAGETRSNAALVRVGTGGKVCITSSTYTELIVDVSGWFSGNGSIVPLSPVRIADTRTGLGGSTRLGAGTTQRVSVAGSNGVAANARGIVANITAVNPSGTGFLTAYPCGTTRPNTSTVNYTSGVTAPNLAIVTLGGGDLCIYTSATTDVLVDLAGWTPLNGGFDAIGPERIVDTRFGQGGSRLNAGGTATFSLPSETQGAKGATVNVTSARASGAGYLTVWPCGARPTTSNLNIASHAAIAGAAIVKPSAGNQICVFSSVATDVLVDLGGSFTGASDFQPVTPARLLDTRPTRANESNTGVPAGTSLTAWPWALRTSAATVPTEVRNGMSCQVFDGYLVALNGGQYLSVDTQCAIFRRSRFTTTGSVSNSSALVQQSSSNRYIEVVQSDFDGGPYHERGLQGDHADMVIVLSKFTRFGQAGVEMNNRNSTASLTVENSYFLETKGWPREDHVDGIQVGGARNVTIRGNTVMVATYGGANGDTSYVSNSALGLWAELGSITGTVLIDRNVLAGGGFSIYISRVSPYVWPNPVIITNNVFDQTYSPNSGIWGPLYPGGLPASVWWSGNSWSSGASLSWAQALSYG